MKPSTAHTRWEILTGLALLLAMVGLPLLGAFMAGNALRPLFQFPPALDIPADYLRFSWLAACAVIVLLVGLGLSWARSRGRLHSMAPRNAAHAPARPRSFPWWAWVALGWTLMWWVLAWNRWEWFAPLQRYTFFPMWIGFIVVVNGLTEARGHDSMMRRRRGAWLGLFPVSAVFWWMFEWLNRFVRNWHYLAVDDFNGWSYALHATVCFSTVLPAVLATAEWLATHPSWQRFIRAGPTWSWFASKRTAQASLAFGAVALLLTGPYPHWFYPALWVAPLLIGLGALVLMGRGQVANEMSRGDWSRAATWMLAALLCGFFWELWNWRSVAKWIYTVPGVERWHVFEMPLLGYVGYLPFGLECLLIADRWLGPPHPYSHEP